MDEDLSHLNTRDAKAVNKIIRDYPEVIPDLFEDVRLSKVSVTHRFELASENPIYQKERKMSPSHNEIVRKEIDCMLAAGVITPVKSPWTSTVVIATKEDGPPAVLCRLSEVKFGDAHRPLSLSQIGRNF